MTVVAGEVRPSGSVGAVLRKGPIQINKGSWIPDQLDHMLKTFNPRTEMGRAVRDILHLVPVDAAAELIQMISRIVVVETSVAAVWRHGPLSPYRGQVWDYGILSKRVVTNAGVAYLVDALQGAVEPELLRFHGLGTGTNAEAVGDTALQTELTTEYTGNVRATGTLAEFAANVFETVGQNLLDGTPGAAVSEFGLFNQAATGGGTLLDRAVAGFGPFTMVATDQLDTTYRFTITAGG